MFFFSFLARSLEKKVRSKGKGALSNTLERGGVFHGHDNILERTCCGHDGVYRSNDKFNTMKYPRKLLSP